LQQVDLAGRHHSLTPLAAACKWAHVFTEPSLYAGALWLPYRWVWSLVVVCMTFDKHTHPSKPPTHPSNHHQRREEAMIRSALAAAGAGVTNAIFAHADVVRS
jgi:hypothetical protein